MSLEPFLIALLRIYRFGYRTAHCYACRSSKYPRASESGTARTSGDGHRNTYYRHGGGRSSNTRSCTTRHARRAELPTTESRWIRCGPTPALTLTVPAEPPGDARYPLGSGSQRLFQSSEILHSILSIRVGGHPSPRIPVSILQSNHLFD